ncbi:hypothetical protein FRC06_001208 [Ceratobasidium sp. 370]|nr:hypothetical protein FRC06_001208 [Ceratobasidium sp. 370]
MSGRIDISAPDLSQEHNTERFDDWCQAVKLPNGTEADPDLPAELATIKEESNTFPSWIGGNDDSPPYSSLDPSLRPFARRLRADPDRNHQIGDNEANKSLAKALPTILRSYVRMQRYNADYGLLGEAANFRTIVNVIMLDAIWHPEAEYFEQTHLTMEPTLNLPKASGSGVSCTSVTPDSAFCISAGDDIEAPVDTRRAFSSLANQGRVASLLLPHLLTEFESPETAGPPAMRQLILAMVSALYQRRALRQTEHFVFGICHTGPLCSVDVIAARWVPKATEPPTADRSVRDAEATADYAHASTSKVTPGASRQTDEEHLELDLKLPIDLVRLYLMILATIPLAVQYRSQIVENPPTEPAPGFGDWSEDKTNRSRGGKGAKGGRSQTSNSRTSRTKRARVEEPEESSSDPVDFISKNPVQKSLSVGHSAKNEQKLSDIQRLPEISPYHKSLHYVRSLSSYL